MSDRVEGVRETQNASEIVDRVRLEDVSFSEVSGRRLESATDFAEDPSAKLMVRENDREVQARVELEVRSEEASLRLSSVATFGKLEPFTMSSASAEEFLQKVAVFAIWPYLRAEVQQLSSTLGVPSVALPLLRQGEVQLQGS